MIENNINSDDLVHLLLPDSSQNYLVDILRRKIWISGEIGFGMSRTVIRGLLEMAKLSDASITIFINTEGGDPYESMIVADVIRELNKTHVIKTCVMGVSYSAGVILSTAGKLGYRTAIPSSDFLIHQLSIGGVQGKIEDVAAATNNLKRLNYRIGKMLSLHTGQDLKTIKSLMDAESYLSPEEALSLGIIDRIEVPVN